MVPEVTTALPRPALAGHVGRIWGVRSAGPAERRSEAPVPGAALVLALEHDRNLWSFGTYRPGGT